MLGIVTGLQSELKLARRGSETRLCACAGGSAARAEERARELVAQGATALLSFGLGGGLAEVLEPGAVVIADRVVETDGDAAAKSWPTDPDWTASLMRREGMAVDARIEPVLGHDAPVQSSTAKLALSEQTGAALVDMESHGVARAAFERGIPFAVVRVVADPASCTLPEVALLGMDAHGNTRPLRVLGALLRRPQELPALIRLARQAGQATKVLAALANLPLAK